MEFLSARLGRDGSKETTLDYAGEFAQRRGLADRLGVRGEIEVSRETAREKPSSFPARQPAGQEPAQDAGRLKASIEAAKLAFHKSYGAMKAREAFAQAEAKKAEAERERQVQKQEAAQQNPRGHSQGM